MRHDDRDGRPPRDGEGKVGTFSSLHNRNFRLFWSGQLVSLTGSWMQTTAMAWLVLNQLHSHGTVLGLLVAVQFTPTLVGGPWAGLVADRRDKRKILLFTQSSAAVLAGALAVLTLTGVVRLWMVFAIMLLVGVVTMFDSPARQSFITEMVGKGDVANAVGLNSAIFNAARIVGPAVAGGLILAGGTGVCFALNSVSFVAVIAGIVAMRPADLFRGEPAERARGQVRAGFRYAMSVPELKMTLAMVAIVGTFAMNFTVVLPLIAKVTFHGNAGAYGLLTAAMGAGALVGALVAATRARPTVHLLTGAAIALGVCMLAAASAPTLAVEFAVIAVTGGAAILFMSTCNATLQLNSRSDMRGRVIALYMVLFLGSTPIGGPIVGWIGQYASPRWGMAVGGIASLLAGITAALFLWRARRASVVAGETADPPASDRAAKQPALT
jgi:MFS family permease